VEGQLVHETFTLDNIDLDCWVIKIDCKFWFKAHNIAVFLNYNVPPEERKSWEELDPGKNYQVPSYWTPNTVFISEGGFYRLLCRSTKPQSNRFEKWVFDDVLPTLCETGQYQLEKSFHEQLAIKDTELAKIRGKVLELYDKVAVMTISDETKHVFRLYRNLAEPNNYLFIRTQSKYLQQAMKAVNHKKI
jgi:prophage antirepressor-like protein